MVNLREQAVRDLAFTLEGYFGLPMKLIDPDGVLYEGLVGRVDYDTKQLDPETGEPVVVSNPLVTLCLSSLTRVPEEGEEGWVVYIPESPSTTAPLVPFLTDDRSIKHNKSLDLIDIYLTKAVQE